MKIHLEDLKISKVLSGFFYEQDFRYENLKYDFFNEVKNIFSLAKLEHFPLGDIDVLVSKERTSLQLRMTKEDINYEDLFITKEDFVNKSIEIASAWRDKFHKDFIKFGGVIYFVLVKSELDPIEFVNNYFQPFLNHKKIKSSKFHFNYSDFVDKIEYNINFTLAANEQLRNIEGVLDLNKFNGILKVEDGQKILNDLFVYFENNLLNLLNKGVKI